MKIIFALGNPGLEYSATRHNVGFLLLENYARAQHINFIPKSKFSAQVAELTTSADKALLVKPTTYYNLVGQTARALLDFYKLDLADFLIIHDDLALPLGTIRTRIGGSSAGNNGIKSLNDHLGEFTARLRVGTFSDKLPAGQVSSVLGNLSASEIKAIRQLQPEVNDIIDQFIAGSFNETTYR